MERDVKIGSKGFQELVKSFELFAKNSRYHSYPLEKDCRWDKKSVMTMYCSGKTTEAFLAFCAGHSAGTLQAILECR